MEQKLSSNHRQGDLSGSDSDIDPEREFSGDDDDDRNHKHRRREIRSQSSEFEAPQSVSSKPFNKSSRPFQNGNSFRGNRSRLNGGWKNNSFVPPESDLLKSDRHFDMPMFSRPHMDINQRIGLGQTYYGDSGFARGGGIDSWNAHAPRFISVASNPYAGRGLSNVAGVHTAAWNPYGLLTGIPNGGIDAVHSLGINSSLRPSINPPSNSGIIRQKCSDFEERGFCLRGDMCPMEHGVNRIVVDDVQSLSKFNLPVSIPGGNGLGVGGGSGPLPAGTASAGFSVNNNKRKMVKSKTARNGTNSDAVGTFSSSAAAANDFYDPDQPLWNKNGPGSSTALSQPCSPEIQREEPNHGGNPSIENPDEVHSGSDVYPLPKSACSGADSHNLTKSSLGILHGTGRRSELKGQVSVIPNLPGRNDYIQNKEETLNKNQTPSSSAQGVYALSANMDTNGLDTFQKRLKGSSRNSQRPPQKALQTLFVNGIPLKDNNFDALRSHFQKFGEIIDIYIPSNGEKAFVQFSKREEAEAALKAPDAVMGNRFIKLWWANRDNIPDISISGGSNPFMNPFVGTAYSGPTSLSISSKGRINQHLALKANASHVPSSTTKVNAVSSAHITVSDQGKPVISTGLVTLAPSQRKLDNLEVMKEELRKKQELLDQKRNDFKRQLEKLEKQKQTAGGKIEPSSDHPAKKQRVMMSVPQPSSVDVAKRIAPQSADVSTSVTLPEAGEVKENVKPESTALVPDPNTGSALQNYVLQKETVHQHGEASNAIVKDVTDKIAVPDDKPTPHEELVEGQPSVYDEEKACYNKSTKADVVKQGGYLSEGDLEKADDEKSHYGYGDSVKTPDDQDYDEDSERAHDRQLSDEEFRRELSIKDKEVEEKTREGEDRLSGDDAM